MNAMSRQYIIDFSRGVFSSRFMLGVLLCPLLVILDNPVDFRQAVRNPAMFSMDYFYFHSIVYGGLFGTYILNTLCALPFAPAAQTELNTGYCLYAIRRVNKKTYLLSKYVVTLVSGGLVNSLGILLTVFLLLAFFPAYIKNGDLISLPYFRLLYSGNVSAFIAFVACMAFLRGAVWSSIAVMLSLFTKSKTIVTVVPFAGLFLIHQTASTLKISNTWRPDMWLVTRTAFLDSEILSLLMCLWIAVLCTCACWGRFYRKGSELIED